MAQQPTGSSSEPQDPEFEHTTALLREYVFGRAKVDNDLNSQEFKTFMEARQIQSDGVPQTRVSPSPAFIGKILGGMGGDIDARYQKTIQTLAQWSGPPEQALKTFKEVAKTTFSDGHGGVKITPGRIVVMLNYCYHLCKTYTSQNVAAASLISFITIVATWLCKSFLEAKVFDWLWKQGGWSKLVAISGKNMLLFIGLGSLAIWALAYFTGN